VTSLRIKEIKKAVNILLKKVHPDFFRKDERIANVNESSLSTLNSFLDIIEENSQNAFFRFLKSKTPERFKIEFFMKGK